MASSQQIKLIQVAKRQLCLSDDDYRAILQKIAHVRSSRDLDNRGFDRLLREFKRLGFTSTAGKHNYGERPGMASPKQVALIRQFWREWQGDMDQDNDKGLNAWLHKYHKVSALRMISEEKAKKVIPSLRAMAKRNKNAQA